ncbi:MAG: efflux RND transporter permease subunit [Proteobacteria bacterium]|nr:efflux RND transporter permease subunit [Pseudomonadota bacterium]
MKITETSVNRPLTTIMVFLFLVLMGLYSATKLEQALLPDVEPPMLSVVTTYPGANASDVETNLTRRLEDRLSTVTGLEKMTSVSKDNLSVVALRFKWGTDLDVVANDIRDQIDQVRRDLPSEAEKPWLLKMSSGQAPIMFMGVTATESYRSLFQIVDKRIVDQLKRVTGVGAVIVIAGLERQINVELGQRQMAAHGLTFFDIARALKAANLNVPAGELKIGGKQFIIRVPERFKTIRQIKDTIVAIRGGRPVRLGDVAEVTDAFKDPFQYLFTHLGPSILLIIQKQSGANTISVVDGVHRALAGIRTTLPADVKIVPFFDSAVEIKNSLKNLFTSVLIGALLVVLVTLVFLRRWRPSLIIALAIPFSLTISFAFMLLLGYTLNTISMMSLAIAIGMVVDNAVVVLENITRHKEEYGASAKSAAIYATQEVGTAVMASTLTTIAVFAPMLLIGGIIGIIFRPLAAVVTVCLTTSFVLAMTLTPSLAAKLMAKQKEPQGLPGKLARFGEMGFQAVDNGYAWLIDKALRVRWLVLLLSGGLFVASILGAGKLGSEFFPNADSGDIEVTLELPADTRLEETARVARQVMEIYRRVAPDGSSAWQLDRSASTFPALVYRRTPLVQIGRWTISGQSEQGFMTAAGMPEGSNIIWGGLKLVSIEKRKQTVSQIAQRVRQELARVPGIDKITITDKGGIAKMFGLTGKPIQLEITGFDFEVLKRVARRVRKLVRGVKGAISVTISQRPDRRELWVRVDRTKAGRLGISAETVSQTIRSGFYGLLATKFWDSGDEYDVFLRLAEKRRRTLDDILNLEVPTPTGKLVPLRGLVKISERMGPTQIDRLDQARLIKVESNVYGRSVGEVSAEIKGKLATFPLPPGVRIKFGGDVEEQAKSFQDLAVLLMLGIAIVFMVMASQFESLKGPFVVMFAMPFAFSGMVAGALLGGVTLNVISFMGLVMLMGIVVNNAIVLVDYVNLLRARGLPLREALVEGGRRRLRPVLMTATTTICTMIPLAVSTAEGSETWRPLGWAMLGGLSISTVVTMILVPVLYSFFLKRGETVSRRQLGKQQEAEEALA